MVERSVAVGDGCTLRVVTQGDGAIPVVLLHGGPGWPDYLDSLAGLFDDTCTVHRFDQRGCGRSGGEPPWELQRFVADVDDLRAALGHDRWHVVGHSWGATLGLLHALDQGDRVATLSYLSGTGLEWRGWVRAYKEEQQRRLTPEERQRLDQLAAGHPRSRPEEVEFLRLLALADAGDRDAARIDATALAEHAAAAGINYDLNHHLNRQIEGLDPTALAARCSALTSTPVLIVHGQRDPRPAAALDTLVAALPRVDVAVLEGVGHDVHTEAPARLRRLLLEHFHRADRHGRR